MRSLKNLKRNDEGITLVELIVCIALLGLLAMGVATYITRSSRIYSSGKDETNAQIKLQMTIDNIGNDVIECKSIELMTTDPSATKIRYLLKKSETEAIVIIFNQTSKELSRRNVTITEAQLNASPTALKDAASESNDTSSNTILLMGTVIDFQLTDVPDTNQKMWKVYMQVEQGNKKKECSKQVKLRNA